MNDIEQICFKLITYSGDAKSLFYEAIDSAKQGNFEDAEEKIDKANDSQVKAHNIHMDLIQKELGENDLDMSLILVHAEDQMMQTELMEKLARELVDLYKKIE